MHEGWMVFSQAVQLLGQTFDQHSFIQNDDIGLLFWKNIFSPYKILIK